MTTPATITPETPLPGSARQLNRNVIFQFAVCCYNSQDRICEALRAICTQPASIEIVIINNHCTDRTIERIEDFRPRLPSRMTINIIQEDRQGLVFARRAALNYAVEKYKTTQSEVILCFVDDDNHLMGDWTSTLSRLFTDNSEITCVGGIGIPKFDHRQPDWWKDLEAGFACGSQGPAGIVPFERGYLYGAGLALRISFLAKHLTHFSPSLTGRIGASMLGGDDAELCYFILKNGGVLWHEPTLQFHHQMPEKRLRLTQVFLMYQGFGRASRTLNRLKSQCKQAPLKLRILSLRIPHLALTIAKLSVLLAKYACQKFGGNKQMQLQTKIRIHFHYGAIYA